MKKMYIIGAGGFGRETAWLAERINKVSPTWDIQGFLDDNIKLHGSQVDSYKVLGGCDYLKLFTEDVWAVCAIGTAVVRKKVIEEISQFSNVHFATLIDPSVLISSRITIGEGSIVCAGNIFTVDITIGKHVIVNLDCTIGHDAVIEDFVTLYPSVNVSGCAIVRKCAELGTGAQILQGKKIGKGTIVGAGAVVTKDLPEDCTAVGAPARPVKFR